ncbi:Telomeric repeat-binding factor 2, partial [Colius striatus]
EPLLARMLRVMQLLSRIEEGENLDCTFDKESELTPLESAIAVLELIQREFSVPEKTMETVQKMVKEAAVIVCIKNKEFDKAAKIVKRHLGKEPRTLKKRNELLAVIKEKDFTHPLVKNFSYKSFQQSVFQFLKPYMDDSEPLLLSVRGEQVVFAGSCRGSQRGQRLLPAPEPPGRPAGLCLSCRQPAGTVTTYGISDLREAFKILSGSPDSDVLFTKLDQTDFSFPKQLSPSVSHRTKRRKEEENRGSETSDPAEMPHKSKRSLSISRLVMERDSQHEASESPDSSQEPVVSSASRPGQKLHDQPVSFQGRWNSSAYGEEEKDSWSDEDELFSDAGKRRGPGAQARKWTIQESEWIKEGVKKFGEGRWKAICQKYPFQNRTAVMIKDRWRTMKKLGIL